MRRVSLFVSASFVAAVAAASVPAASAQTAQPESSQGESRPQDDVGIADIVVTAQRRSESSQSVPISLQSFSSETLEQSGVRNTEDLTNVVGGLVIQPTSARPAVFVRGVGTNSSNATPAVLSFVDGIYYPFGQSFDFANVSSIEVLKGPQGTLFGRNATGGVIQVTTAPPSDVLSSTAEFGYGNYRTVETSAYVTGPLAKGLAFDLGLRYRDQGEGFGRNVFNGDDVFFTDRAAARGRLQAKLGEAVTLTVGADYSRVKGTVGTNVSPAFGYDVLYVAGALQRRGPGQYFPGLYDVNAGPFTPGYLAEEWGVNGTLEAELEGVTLRSITSYRHSMEDVVIDYDGTPAPTLTFFINRPKRVAFTQELQALSNGDGPFEWTVGAFYYFNHTRTRYQLAVTTDSTDRDLSASLYAQGTYEVLPGTRLTLGGRYTDEKREIDGTVFIGGVQQANRTGKDSLRFREFTWRVALDQRINKNVLAYASVSRGFNAGFFNQGNFGGFANRTQNPAVLPEYLTAYEIGLKSDLLGRRLRVNLSGFRYDYNNLQQQIYDQGAVKTINAANARIQGLDFEIVARPVSALTLSVSGTYLDPRYKSYPQAPNYVRQANGTIVAVGNINASGNVIVNAPEISFTANASYVMSIDGVGRFTTTANLYHRGKMFSDPTERYPLTNPYVLNLTERWDAPDGHIFATVWVKNLTNEHYDFALNILAPAGLVGNVAPPRTYGASVGFTF